MGDVHTKLSSPVELYTYKLNMESRMAPDLSVCFVFVFSPLLLVMSKKVQYLLLHCTLHGGQSSWCSADLRKMNSDSPGS